LYTPINLSEKWIHIYKRKTSKKVHDKIKKGSFITLFHLIFFEVNVEIVKTMGQILRLSLEGCRDASMEVFNAKGNDEGINF